MKKELDNPPAGRRCSRSNGIFHGGLRQQQRQFQKRRQGKFIVGFLMPHSRPMAIRTKNGEYVGFDLGSGCGSSQAERLGTGHSPSTGTPGDMELNSGTISCIWNGFTMNGREDEYAWTELYVDNSQVFVVMRTAALLPLMTSPARALLYRPILPQRLPHEDDNKELKDSFKELVVVSDYNTAFMNLDSNAVEAIAMDIGVAKYQMESRDGKYKILDNVLSAEQYAVGFAKNNTELRDKVQKTLDEMREDGKFAEIAEKWDLTDSVID